MGIMDWEVINGLLQWLYQEQDPEQLYGRMLQVLTQLVPADSLYLIIVLGKPPRTMRVVTLPAIGAPLGPLPLVQRFRKRCLFYHYYHAALQEQWERLVKFQATGGFHSYPAVETSVTGAAKQPPETKYNPAGQLFGTLGMFQGNGFGIALNREIPFTFRERKMLDVMHPHLVSSLINATGKNTKTGGAALADHPSLGAYAHFDPSGKVIWIQDKARTWLNDFFADEPTTGTLRPPAIHQLVSRTIKDGRRGPSLETHRGHEQLSACLTSSVGGGWILQLHRKRNQPMIRFQPLPQFSARKNEILRWLVEGKRNGEIAAILKLSPRTVEKHVQDILNEFKVENRATAIVRAVELCAMPHGETPMGAAGYKPPLA